MIWWNYKQGEKKSQKARTRSTQQSYLSYQTRRNPDNAALNMRPGFAGDAPRTCQFIAGEPTGDDSCKCGAPAMPQKAWCADHFAVVYRSD